MTATERFWAKVIQDPGGGCLLWCGATVPAGYGQLSVDGRTIYAHRFAWEQVHGPIPDGLQVDHLCRVRRCVNVAHMELVTLRVNVLRGVGLSAVNATKTHCKSGHPLEGPNLYRTPEGWRKCRRCKAASRRRRRMARA